MAFPADDTYHFRNQLLYPLDDPQVAFDNAMRDNGYRLNAANPFIDVMRRSAPGLATTYAMRASSPNAGGGMYGDPTERGMADFGQYLRDNLRSGNMVNEMKWGASTGLPEAVNGLRQYQDALQAGNGQNINPYTAYLNDQFSADNGKGLVNSLVAMRAPTLGTGVARAYRSGLDSQYSSAFRNLVNAGDTNQDIWRYILGF